MRIIKAGIILKLAPSIFSTAFLFLLLFFSPAGASSLGDVAADCGAVRERFTFNILRKAKKIGIQTVNVYDCGGVQTAVIDVDISFRMALLRIKAKQTVIEQWRDGVMTSFQSERTASFSEDMVIDAKYEEGVWRIVTNGTPAASEVRLGSTAYWTADLVHADAVLNIDTGEVIPIIAQRKAEDVYELQRSDGKVLRIVVDGERIVSTQLINDGDVEISFVRTSLED